MDKVGSSDAESVAKGTPSAILKKLESLVPDQEASPTSVVDGLHLAYRSERLLVAWVLLSRLEDVSFLSRKPQGTILCNFARDLMLLWGRRRPNTDAYFSLVRLVAQVTSRVSDPQEYPEELGNIMLQVWQQDPSLRSIDVDIDVLRSIELWLMMEHEELVDISGILSIIWNGYATRLRDYAYKIRGYTKGRKDDNDIRDDSNAASSSENDETDKDENFDTAEAKEWRVMSETLARLVNSNEKKQPKELLEDLSETMISVLQSHGSDISQLILPHVIDVIATCSYLLSSSTAMTLHEWLLSLIQQRTLLSPDAMRLCIQRAPRMMPMIHKILLAHVVSPVDHEGGAERSSLELRALAWQTIITLVETCGWHWIMLTAQENQAYGKASQLCTWIRLASGEWRIQLQAVAARQSHRSMTGHQATAVPIGHACARLLLGAVHFVVRLSEQQEQQQQQQAPPLSMVALNHLRLSFQEALATTVDFVHHVYSRKTSYDSMAVRLLGTLLMEVDIWQEATPATVNTLLESIPRILSTEAANDTEDEKLFSYLLPGLVALWASTETNESHGKMLFDYDKEHGLSDALIEYLGSFWKHCCEQEPILDTCNDSVVWACSCADVWHAWAKQFWSHDSTIPREILLLSRQLSRNVVEWVQYVVQEDAHRLQQTTVQSYLSLAVDSYNVLQDGQQNKPREHEIRIIRKAKQICALRLRRQKK